MNTTQTIKTWSFSRWDVFVKCPYAAFLKFVAKEEEKVSAKSQVAMARGRQAHDDAEAFIRGTLPVLPRELMKFQDNFLKFKDIFAESPSHLVMEEEWGYDKEWQVTDYWGDEVWFRAKLDRMYWLDPEQTSAEIVDYKTGRKFGNEVKHNQQGQLYAIVAFLRYPTLQSLKVTFEYLDEGKPASKSYSREQAMALLPGWDTRGKSITQATVFPPRPNKISCKYCPFGPSNGTGSCDYGVEA